MALSLIGVSLPTFLIGILLILFFSVLLGWLPSFGRGDTVRIGRGGPPACSRSAGCARWCCPPSRWDCSSSR